MMKPGGIAAFSSCAYHISPSILQETIRIGAGEAGRQIRVIDETYQPADHPWILQFPESLYLKTLYVQA